MREPLMGLFHSVYGMLYRFNMSLIEQVTSAVGI